MAFDQKTRNLLQRTVTACRRALDREFTAQLQELYGIQPDGTITPCASLEHLGDEELAVARLLRERINHLEGGSDAEALTRTTAKPDHIARVIREQAFTVLNRLAALRLCEERGLVLECVRQGVNSEGFQLFMSSAGNALGETHEAYRVYLHCLFDELAIDLGVLFDRFSPLALLFPRPDALAEVLSELNGTGKAAEREEIPPERFAQIWQADETIGWIYQYYNDETERKKMREESAAPRNSRELAVRNQFFTPRYVVEFLTDNTLGRIWYEMTGGVTSLKEKCRYLVRRPNEFFLQDSSRHFRNSRPGFMANGLADLPADPTWDEMQAVALCLGFSPYELSKQFGPGDCKEFAEQKWTEYQASKKYEGTFVELLCCLFIEQREWHFSGYGDQPGEADLNRSKTIYQALIGSLKQEGSGLTQEELLKQPVFIPHRPLKDPRTILMLDPACGSMHFGLYAFDLFEVIYDEAWHHPDIGPKLQADYGVRSPLPPKLDPASVCLQSDATLRCVLSGRNLTKEEAYIALKPFDQKSKEVRGTPVLCHREEAERRRGQYRHVFPLVGFSFAEALAKEWFSDRDAQAFLKETAAFEFKLIEESAPPTKEAAYEQFKRDVPRLIIEHNIHGIDIDPRAAQIAGLALWLRAQRVWKDMGIAPSQRPRITRSNIVCAEPMPGEKELLREFVEKEFPVAERGVFLQLLETIFDKMQLAGEAGSLLKIEEEIRSAIETAREAWVKVAQKPHELFTTEELNQATRQPELATSSDFRLLTSDFWQTAESRIYAALRDYAEQAESGGGFQRRLFAEDAARGFAFIDVCRKRYDVTLMNPPFGESSKAGKQYLEKNYARSSNDLLAAFVERGLNYLESVGLLGAITSRTGFFLSSFQEWREQVLLPLAPPIAFADLGQGVLDTAMVETAAYCLAKGQSRNAVFIRLHSSDDRGRDLLEAIESLHDGCSSAEVVFNVHPCSFRQIPGSPFSYWVSESIRNLFAIHGSFEDDEAVLRVTNPTADEFRFLRNFWECRPSEVGRTNGWVPYAKGGSSKKFYYDVNLLAIWDNITPTYKGYVGTIYRPDIRPASLEFFFRPGIMWPLRAPRMCAQMFPEGTVFSARSQCLFAPREKLAFYLGLLNSCTLDYLFKAALGRTDFPEFIVGILRKLPKPKPSAEHQRLLGSASVKAAMLAQRFAISDEVGHLFVTPMLIWSSKDTRLAKASGLARLSIASWVSEIQLIQDELDDLSFEVFSVSDADKRLIQKEAERFADLTSEDEDDGDGVGIGRNEIASLLSDTSALAGWLVGLFFGRWDIRYATGEQAAPELPDPFAPLPVCPPGQLQNAQGLPARPEDVPATYPITIQWDGIIADDPTHPVDIERCVREVIEVIWGRNNPPHPGPLPQERGSDSAAANSSSAAMATTASKLSGKAAKDSPSPPSEGGEGRGEVGRLSTLHAQPSTPSPAAIEQEACEILGVNSLRDYFRRPAGFFADHLKRYSKSRRQAPIYWPLATASGSYTLWIYYHRLDDQTLYKCIQQFIDPKLADVEKELTHLRAVLAANEGGAKERKRLEELETFRRELIELRTELELWAPKWKPNLNDGVLITAAPLWKLFRLPKWQRDLKACWQELEKGDYDWSHLAYTLWPDRVREKCKSDRSLAIAHGLEDLCAVKAPEKKVKKAKVKKAQLDLEEAE